MPPAPLQLLRQLLLLELFINPGAVSDMTSVAQVPRESLDSSRIDHTIGLE